MEQFPSDHILLHLAREKGYQRIAEIGVYGGNLTGRVVGTLLSEGKPFDKYYCIDPWKPYTEFYHRAYSDEEADPEWWEMMYQKVVGVYNRYPDNIVITRATSVEASEIYKREGLELDAVYIDSIHDEMHAVQDIYGWLPMIRRGGMISGHDYIKTYSDMAVAISNIFGDRLNLMIKDPDKPALSQGNTHQGGNWWAFVNNKWKTAWMRRIEELYPQHIEAMK